jgi:hypothetical protein
VSLGSAISFTREITVLERIARLRDLNQGKRRLTLLSAHTPEEMSGAMERQQGPGDSWPPDAASAVALVARIKSDIEDGSDESREILLADLLCAAWPSGPAQDH